MLLLVSMLCMSILALLRLFWALVAMRGTLLHTRTHTHTLSTEDLSTKAALLVLVELDLETHERTDLGCENT